MGTINTRQIQDYLTSGEAQNMQIEGTAASQEVVTFFDLDKAVITDHAGLTGVGVHTHTTIDTHLTSTDNPHGVTWLDVGASPSTHGHPISHISDWPASFPPEAHTHDDVYYNRTLFRDYSAGAIDGGKPVRLDADGRISASMVSMDMFSPQGNWDPSIDNDGQGEYPDGATAGQFWLVSTITNPDGTNGDGNLYYIFTGGSLNTSQISTADMLIKTEAVDGWMLKSAADYSAYYPLDGTLAITAPFAGGGQLITNIADGVSPGDASTYGQLTTGLADTLSTANSYTDSRITTVQAEAANTVKSIVPVGETAEVVLNFIVMTKAEYAGITPQPGTVYGLKD